MGKRKQTLSPSSRWEDNFRTDLFIIFCRELQGEQPQTLDLRIAKNVGGSEIIFSKPSPNFSLQE
jgi:hypothetical protein